MPWQELVLDVALELTPRTKRLIYREVDLTVPRQSGKTTLLLVLILLRALSQPRQNIVYTAQTAKDARKKWEDDWLPILEPSSFGKLFRVRRANGHEALLFKNGSVQSLIATTKKTGHGGSLDLAILDEAFAHPDARLEQATKPATITRPQPQLWVVSTAGTPEDSPYLLGKVERGRELVTAGVNSKVAYFEWSAATDAPPDDPATWRTCMPALGHTVTEEAVAADFASMESLSEFCRAYLNRWMTQASDPVIPMEKWVEAIDEASTPSGTICLAFDVTPDRSTASIGLAAKRADGLGHVEVVSDAQSGTTWVPDELARLWRQHNPSAVMCDPGGPAGSLIPEIERRGVTVTTMTAKEHAQACGRFYDDVMEGKLRHLGTTDLAVALDGAGKRPLGDSWAWSRKSPVDISPLVAVTLANWGRQTVQDHIGATSYDDWLRSMTPEAIEAKKQAAIDRQNEILARARERQGRP